jgi:polyhydroxyalkanoate synthase
LEQKAQQLRQSLEEAGPTALEGLDQALATEAGIRHQHFLDGIEAYRHHPYRRRLEPAPAIWSQGTSRLLDYRTEAGQGGPPVLVVPSLINRAYILDLLPRRSLMRYLAAKGLAPFLVDWDAPGPQESGFTLTDYIAGRLSAMLDEIIRVTGQKPVVVGYCMGGLLALALAQLRGPSLAGLVLLATPFDFVTGREANAKLMKALAGPMGQLIDAAGQVPADMLQAMFASLDPGLAARKFTAFARLKRKSARARDFVALEDWANDCVALAGPVAKECLFGWYGDNDPVAGNWRVAGQVILPEKIALPTLVMVPERDRIVPPASALPLAERIGGAKLMVLKGGHVGLLTGPRAWTEVYGPLMRWIQRKCSNRAVAPPPREAV